MSLKANGFKMEESVSSNRGCIDSMTNDDKLVSSAVEGCRRSLTNPVTSSLIAGRRGMPVIVAVHYETGMIQHYRLS